MLVADTAAALPPAKRAFLSTLGRAAADLTRARDHAAAALDAPDDAALHRAFGFAHKATGRLHDAVAKGPGENVAGDPLAITERAITQANAGIVELQRALDGKPVSLDAVRDAWNSAVHDIGTAQNLVKYPPSEHVYDGS